MEVVASLSQGRTAAAQCGLFTYKSVPVIFEPPLHIKPTNALWKMYFITYGYSATFFFRTRDYHQGISKNTNKIHNKLLICIGGSTLCFCKYYTYSLL